MPPAVSVTYLVNPAAGGGRAGERWRQLQERSKRQLPPGSILMSSRPGDLESAAARLATEGAQALLVAVGGDGTALEVANGILRATGGGPRPVMAVLPLGSGNDTARMTGITDIDSALAAITGNHRRELDTIRVEYRTPVGTACQHALVFAGAGLAADIIRRTPPGLKRRLGGRWGYIAGFFLALARHHPYPMTLGEGGSVRNGRFAAIVAANHTHAGGHTMHIGPGAVPDDGAFDLSVIEGVGRLAVARQFLRLLHGTHVHHPAVRYSRGTRLDLDGTEPVPIQIDGEYVGTTPAVFELRPASLRVAVPPGGPRTVPTVESAP
jgi:YegS/Rv2252/BmrU family lipid kinase